MENKWPSPQEIVDWYCKQSGYPYTSFSVLCRTTNRRIIDSIRTLIFQTEVGNDTFGLYRTYSDQHYKLSVPLDLLQENRELYTVIIREVLATDTVEKIGFFN